MAFAGSRRVLIIVQNLPVPFDRRVWLEATTLRRAGYDVSVICPKAKGFTRSYERLEDVHIHRYTIPIDARGSLGFVAEFSVVLRADADEERTHRGSRSGVRRHSRVQPAGDVLAARAPVATVRKAVPVRPSRSVAGDVCREVREIDRRAVRRIDVSRADDLSHGRRRDHDEREPSADSARSRERPRRRRVHRALGA